MNSLKSKSKTIPRAFLQTAHTSKVKFGSAHERVVLLSLLFSAIYAGSGWLSSNGFLQFALLVSVFFFSHNVPCVSRNDEFCFFLSRLFLFCFCVYCVLDFLIFKHLIRLVFLYTFYYLHPFAMALSFMFGFRLFANVYVWVNVCVYIVQCTLLHTKIIWRLTAYCTACITLTVLLIFRCCFEVQRIRKKLTHTRTHRNKTCRTKREKKWKKREKK